MLETTGDIWEYAYEKKVDAVCVLTNMTTARGKLIMGAGQARQARDRFPLLPAEWGEFYIRKDTRSLLAIHDPCQGFKVVSFPTKVHPSDDSDLALIRYSALQLRNAADEHDWNTIVLPRPGCGLGGLRWPDVKPVLDEILDDRFVSISNVP